jgi:sulfonate dioxygenase
VHSAVPQAELSARNNGPVRREPVETEHPLVRAHPVTGEKALFINQGFTKSIVGFKKEESDALLGFLFEHIEKGADFRVRARYEKGSVVVWVSCYSLLEGNARLMRIWQ